MYLSVFFCRSNSTVNTDSPEADKKNPPAVSGSRLRKPGNSSAPKICRTCSRLMPSDRGPNCGSQSSWATAGVKPVQQIAIRTNANLKAIFGKIFNLNQPFYLVAIARLGLEILRLTSGIGSVIVHGEPANPKFQTGETGAGRGQKRPVLDAEAALSFRACIILWLFCLVQMYPYDFSIIISLNFYRATIGFMDEHVWLERYKLKRLATHEHPGRQSYLTIDKECISLDRRDFVSDCINP